MIKFNPDKVFLKNQNRDYIVPSDNFDGNNRTFGGYCE